MTQLTHFKPALYLLILLGIAGFALVPDSPGLMVMLLGMGGTILNAWLVATGRFRPLPRLAANLVTIAAMLFFARQLSSANPGPPALIIGQFLVILQLVKLWEQRQNRDYGQLIVLSLLLMVAAAINADKLSFALLFSLYLLLALYVCLLFHLRVETDKARAAGASVADAVEPTAAAERRDRRLLNRSMRRLTGGVTAVAVATAVVVFVLFPRGSGSPLPNSPLSRQPQAMTGFSEQVNFDGIARIQQDDKIVGDAEVFKNGRRLGPGDVVYLRGLAVDRYRSRGARARWERESAVDAPGPVEYPRELRLPLALPGVSPLPRPPVDAAAAAAGPPSGGDRYVQRISLTLPGTRVMFAVAGPIELKPRDDVRVLCGSDGAIQAEGSPPKGGYEVVSTGRTAVSDRDRPDLGARRPRLASTADVPGANAVLLRVAQVEGEERDGYARDGDVVVDVEGRPVSELPPADRRRAVADAYDRGLQLGVLRAGQPHAVHPVARLNYRNYVEIASRLTSPPFLRSFGPREGDVVTAVGGRPLADVPVENRVRVVLEAYRAGQPLTVSRDGTRESGRSWTLPAVPPEVEAYARRPDVSGGDAAGAYAPRRDRLRGGPDPLDAAIAGAIESHLRTQFSYTLDITDAKTRQELDPIVWFLSDDGRRGHCEYFAGAMALMCQSLGMNARVVLGFRCDEFNPFSQTFTVRQAHAHAWVEVLTEAGWQQFDPTSSRGADAARGGNGLFAQLKHLLGWLETGYMNNVVLYSDNSRENLLQSVEAKLARPVTAGLDGWSPKGWGDTKLARALGDAFIAVVAGAAALAVGGVTLIVVWWVRRRLRLRRMAERIGLDALPPDERRRLAVQLAFYDDLLRALDRRRFARKPEQTPLEFARGLVTLPAGAYETVRRLTGIFYRVRYGRRQLSAGSRRRLGEVVGRLDADLGPAA